jgi:hypothetical protein
MPRRHITIREQESIVERAGGCCEYCRSRADFATQSFSIEHVVPISQSGETAQDNLALACPGCNGHKYAKTRAPDPIDGVIVPLYNPRKQDWSENFRWNEDFTHIIGLTPTGRATVDALYLNRPGLVNLRRVLFAVGLHPPADEVD